MKKEIIYKMACQHAQIICHEFCTDFVLNAVEYDGYTVFKEDVEYLKALKEALELD